MDKSRRNVIAIAIAGGATGVTKAQQPGNAGSVKSLDAWSQAIAPQLSKLDEKQLGILLKRNGVTTLDELSLAYAKRYPKLDPHSVAKKFDPSLVFNPLADQGTYEKSPSHDKEPYDKSPNYDRGGFGRTFEKFGELIKPLNPNIHKEISNSKMDVWPTK